MALFLAVTLYGMCLHVIEGANPIVNAPAGSVEGLTGIRCEMFLGIPFAQPPIGDLRWQIPQPLTPWQGVREAVTFGANCAASSDDYVKGNKSEDCLYLNVFRPLGSSASQNLPVMHYLYGGSWEYGGSSDPLFSGDFLASVGEVVVVTSNYRLGPFGFLGSTQLAASTFDNSTGNYGIQDQRAAMKWVQGNIAAFGGDPENVFLFGESAGGGSVATHLVTPRSKGLFRRAGIESGAPCDWTCRNLSMAETHFEEVVGNTQCALSDPNLVTCLRGLSTQEILAARTDNSTSINWTPVIDGVDLPADVQYLWKTQQLNPVDAFFLGTNTNEGTDFTPLPFNLTQAEYYAALISRYGQHMGEAVYQLYPPSMYNNSFYAAAMITTDALFACPARRAARWALQAEVPSVFMYHFEYLSTLNKLLRPDYGVSHASELPFVFNYAPQLVGPDEEALSLAFNHYWTSFASTANPNNPSSPSAWPKFSSNGTEYLVLDLPQSFPDSDFKSSVCDFWDHVFELGCNVSICPCPCNV